MLEVLKHSHSDFRRKIITDPEVTMCQRFNNGDDQLVIPQRSGSKCKANGDYEEIQCDDKSKECWCTDQNGYEITGTRTTGSIKCPAIGKLFWGVSSGQKFTYVHSSRLSIIQCTVCEK